MYYLEWTNVCDPLNITSTTVVFLNMLWGESGAQSINCATRGGEYPLRWYQCPRNAEKVPH